MKEQKYHTLIEFAPDAFFQGDEKGNFIIVNEKAIILTGYSRDELLSMNMSGLFPSDELIEKPLRYDLLNQEHTIISERIICTKNGDRVPVEMNSRAMPDGTYQCFARDITKRKAAELALLSSEERYRNLVENSPNGIAVYQEAKFVYINPAGLKILGCSRLDEIVGKSVLSIVHPDSMDEVIKRMTQVAQGLSVGSLDEKLIRQDGTVFYAEVTALSTSFNNKPAGQVIVTDITERKISEQKLIESEEQFKKLFENAADAIFIAEVETGLIVDANKAAENLLMLPHKSIVGMHQTNLHPTNDENFSKATFNQHIQDNLRHSASSPYETKVICSDGSEVYVEVLANLMVFKGKKCLMGTFRNITQRKETEQKLLEVNQQLQETNATKDKLFSIIAHDLKSPFNSILGLTELILENKSVYDKLKCDLYIGQINSSAKHTLTLLENLLAWAKMQTGQIEFSPLKLNFLPLIQDVTEVLHSLAEIKNISLTIEPSCNTLVYADPQMLEIILRNLISNAIKFTKRGGQIRVSVKKTHKHAEISVADNGVGMNDASLNRLFRIDQSFISSGTDNEKGSGLGLMLCKEFVNRHKGDIHVESIPGKGSRFNFTLPES